MRPARERREKRELAIRARVGIVPVTPWEEGSRRQDESRLHVGLDCTIDVPACLPQPHLPKLDHIANSDGMEHALDVDVFRALDPPDERSAVRFERFVSTKRTRKSGDGQWILAALQALTERVGRHVDQRSRLIKGPEQISVPWYEGIRCAASEYFSTGLMRLTKSWILICQAERSWILSSLATRWKVRRDKRSKPQLSRIRNRIGARWPSWPRTAGTWCLFALLSRLWCRLRRLRFGTSSGSLAWTDLELIIVSVVVVVIFVAAVAQIQRSG